MSTIVKVGQRMKSPERVAIVCLSLFAMVALVSSNIDRVEVDNRAIKMEEELSRIDAQIAKNFERIDANFELLFDSDKTISAELSVTRSRTDMAHERVNYYRDVLLIVSKTCPGRMKLPHLNGDPGRPLAEKKNQ